MTYREIFVNLKDDFDHKKVILLEELLKLPPQIAELEEMILAVSMTNSDAKVRKAATKFIEKHGSELHKSILVKFPKRRYDQRKVAENFKEDILLFEEIPAFNLAVFSKYLYLMSSYFVAPKDYFLANATKEQQHFFFIHNFYKKNSADEISLFMGTQYTIDNRVAQALWDALPELSEQITHIDFRTDGFISMKVVPQMPNIYQLRFRCELEEFPTAIFELTSLQSLLIKTNLTAIPDGIQNLKNLRTLSIGGPLKELPAAIYQLTNLEELYIWDTEITELSPEISALANLKTLDIDDSNSKLRIIPKEVYELPNVNQIYKETIRVAFESQNEYEKVYLDFKYYIKAFAEIELVKKHIDEFEAGNTRKFPELLLAATKCYYDDEHGLKSYHFYEDIKKSGAPDKILHANEAIKKFRFIDERTTEKQFAELKNRIFPFDSFDSKLFLQFITEMIAYNYKLYPFEKW